MIDLMIYNFNVIKFSKYDLPLELIIRKDDLVLIAKINSEGRLLELTERDDCNPFCLPASHEANFFKITYEADLFYFKEEIKSIPTSTLKSLHQRLKNITSDFVKNMLPYNEYALKLEIDKKIDILNRIVEDSKYNSQKVDYPNNMMDELRKEIKLLRKKKVEGLYNYQEEVFEKFILDISDIETYLKKLLNKKNTKQKSEKR